MLLVQDALLVWPISYTSKLGDLPNQPRPLQKLKQKKKDDYWKLAEIFLQRVPCASTGRSVEFLLNLCDDSVAPQSVPRLPWIEQSQGGPLPQAATPPILSRLAPAMRFFANHS